jgi:hypothetical protein
VLYCSFFSVLHGDNADMTEKMSLALPAMVEKIIMSSGATESERAHISIQGAIGPLPSEIRIENCLTDEKGKVVRLKEGAQVTVRVEAAVSDIFMNSEEQIRKLSLRVTAAPEDSEEFGVVLDQLRTGVKDSAERERERIRVVKSLSDHRK